MCLVQQVLLEFRVLGMVLQGLVTHVVPAGGQEEGGQWYTVVGKEH